MHIHFVGIGGTAMGSVAVACALQGHTVTGSDGPVYEPMLSVLAKAGIERYEEFSSARLIELQPDITVIGNAISRGNEELEFVLQERWPFTSMAELVGRLFIDRNTSIVCAGTHGKTTTSSITAWLLEHAGFQPGYLIGGVPQNFEYGCRPLSPELHNSHTGVFVSEGDEYDTAFFDKRSKFVHYRPTIAIVNNLEFDHADIFSSIDAIIASFVQMIRIILQDGIALINADDKNALATVVNAPCKVESVGLSTSSSWRIVDVIEVGPTTQWSLHYNGVMHGTFVLPMPGIHNVRNATMAIAATFHAGLTSEEQQAAMPLFAPPKRRLEEIGTWNSATIIDDFAHHPTAIALSIKALQQKYPAAQLHIVFEPRSNTTTRNFFQSELALCFTGATSVCLGPVNRPERYRIEERLDTQRLVQDICSIGISAVSLDSSLSADPHWGSHAIAFLEGRVSPGDVVAIFSNGDVGGLRRMLTVE